MIMRKISGIFLSVVFCTTLALPAIAQDESPYDDVEIELSEDVAWMDVGVSLLRDPKLPPENFIINLSTAERYTSGCPPLKDMGFDTEYKNDTLQIKILKLTINQSDFPYYKCNNKPRNPKADVVLNKKELQDRNIKKISILDGPLTKTYELALSDEKIELKIPKKVDKNNKNNKNGGSGGAQQTSVIRMQTIDNVKNPMRLWFYPAGTILLYAPIADNDPKQVKEKIRDLATGMGLTPLEDVYADFKTPLVRDDYSYFVDKGGRFSGKTVDGEKFGNISIEKMAYGLEGDVPTTEQIPVFARKPGLYD